jgi:hypothetical protein
MLIAGVDYSMSCPCITVGDSHQLDFNKCSVHYLTDTKRYEGKFKNINGYLFERPTNQMERFIRISEWAYDIIKDCDQIMIEDYAMGSRGKVFHIAENTAMLKYKMHTNRKRWAALPPMSLKKYATGKGNADKPKMYDAFLTETNMDLKKLFNYKGENIGNPISDIVDSYYLAKYLNNNPLE